MMWNPEINKILQLDVEFRRTKNCAIAFLKINCSNRLVVTGSSCSKVLVY